MTGTAISAAQASAGMKRRIDIVVVVGEVLGVDSAGGNSDKKPKGKRVVVVGKKRGEKRWEARNKQRLWSCGQIGLIGVS